MFLNVRKPNYFHKDLSKIPCGEKKKKDGTTLSGRTGWVTLYGLACIFNGHSVSVRTVCDASHTRDG